MSKIAISPSDMVFVKNDADELEADFSDLSGRLVEDKPGEFKTACFQASYNLHAKLGANHFAVYKYLRERVLESSSYDLIEEFNMLNNVFIMGIKIAGERFSQTIKNIKK